MCYFVSKVSQNNIQAIAQIDVLLQQEGIRRDANLDYTCAIYDGGRIIATGSCFKNTLRCFAVDRNYQGEGLLNQIVVHLMEVELQRGHLHLFLYTKISSAKFFEDLGFYEISRVEDTLVFMENRRNGFRDYLRGLESSKTSGKSAAIVMHANPFTLGHQFLIETAAADCDILHLFVLSEEASLIPFAVRKRLVETGSAHIPNLIIHDSGPYIISSATFPSYFLRDEDAIIEGHARLDLAVFSRIADALGITIRYVGEEPTSRVTGIYNEIMARELPKVGIACVVIPRKAVAGIPISASTVRFALRDSDWDTLRTFVPKTTYDYFTSSEAKPVIEAIRRKEDVGHY